MIFLPIHSQIPPQHLLQTLPLLHPIDLHHLLHRPPKIPVRIVRFHRQNNALSQRLGNLAGACEYTGEVAGGRLLGQYGAGVSARLEEEPALRAGAGDERLERLAVGEVVGLGGGAGEAGGLGGVGEPGFGGVDGVVRVEEDGVDGAENVVGVEAVGEGLGVVVA